MHHEVEDVLDLVVVLLPLLGTGEPAYKLDLGALVLVLTNF